MKNTNTIYLLKMGMDNEQTGFNHRIRFQSNNCIYRGEKTNICIDFGLCTPWTIKTTKSGKSKTIRGAENTALNLDAQFTDESGSWALHLPEELKAQLEKYEAPFERYYKYTYENILKIISYLLQQNYNNIQLLERKYIQNYDYNTFESDTYKHDKTMYDNAQQFEELAKAKIAEVKPGVKYDNSSYYYNEQGQFQVCIHYNCYNDHLTFDLSNMEEAINKLNNYTMPEEEIKKAIVEWCNRNKGYKPSQVMTKLY